MTRPEQREGEEARQGAAGARPGPGGRGGARRRPPRARAGDVAAAERRQPGRRADARADAQEPPPARPGLGTLPRRGSMLARDIAPGAHAGALGSMDIKMIAKNDAATGGRTGLDGSVTFMPDPKSPYSSKIGLIQIVKLTDEKGTDINAASMPAASAPHLRTKEDKGTRRRGGLHHRRAAPRLRRARQPDRPQGRQPDALLPGRRAAVRLPPLGEGRRHQGRAADRLPEHQRQGRQAELRLRDGGQGRRQPGHLRQREVGVQHPRRARSRTRRTRSPTAPRPRSTRRWSATATSTSTSR